MIVDAAIFLNETELFEFRYEVLSDVVDLFVVVEADTTHSGQKRSLLFPSLLERRPEIARRTIYHPLSIDTRGMRLDHVPREMDLTTDHWRIENMIRNAIAAPLEALDDEAMLLVSDIDEIPNPEVVRALTSDGAPEHALPIAFRLASFYYDLRYVRHEIWLGTVLTTVGQVRARGPQWHRETRFEMPYVEKGGWHLSYFGGAARIRGKIEAMAHQEFNLVGFKDTDHIQARQRDGLDLFGRPVPITPVTRDYFPAYFLRAADKNKAFFFG